ncbi:hypothetical protein, partial [Ruthenibacterium lactatiformans]|uniref:hypothetical protein n=1 Tax=Ruthenibacterium lactatiformans TaxID=1550024 RepID=UPI003AF040B2
RFHNFSRNPPFSRRVKANFPQSQAISSLFKPFQASRSAFLILHEYLHRVWGQICFPEMKNTKNAWKWKMRIWMIQL